MINILLFLEINKYLKEFAKVNNNKNFKLFYY